ncbi:kinase-like protein [Wolfiporia cocos MD-104 SS10]|uniref:non-specific serine/threonine protein kinase n=1 Tax=Wolfiporia cocos (strain MD-104) TaxID=742152 RepID=A0A2H3IWZ6_WOLCO|nr:kinase-like protein [Wolfiporia cocos MD-104 SS10]
MPSSHVSNKSGHSSSGSLGGFPEEDLRSAGRSYFPARLGQTLERGRYCIVRKLGWGQYSSVWLARDREEDRFVALKILTCEATKALSGRETEQRSDELALLQRIADAEPSHPGFRHNIAYCGSFAFAGPRGAHRCVVTEALGYSLDHIRKLRDDGDRRVRPSIVKRVVKQVLRGLQYLHDVCGIIHTDIKHDSILFRPADIAALAAHALATDPSVAYDCGTEACPPVVPVESQALPLSAAPPVREDALEAVLADVGHSHWRHRHFQEVIQPAALRAPEVILGYAWDTPADIWSVGCIVTELLVGFWLFKASAGRGWGVEEDHLARMTEALDTSFAVGFLDKCAHNSKFFNADGSFAHFTQHDEPTWQIRRLLESFSLLQDAAEVDVAERFILRCLRLVPEERAMAGELADDPWLA